MTAILKMLFPWRCSFDRLGLRAKWWHRLAVVAYFIALLSVLVSSWILAFSSFEPVHSYMPEAQYWAIDTSGNLVPVTLGPVVTQSQHDAAVKQHEREGREPSNPYASYGGIVDAPVGVEPSAVDRSTPGAISTPQQQSPPPGAVATPIAPKNARIQNQNDSNSGRTEYSVLPVGSQTVTAPAGASIDGSIPLKATVDMPNGTTVEFVGKSDHEIATVWNVALRRTVRAQWLLSICIAVAVTLAFSYLLQALYRTSLYVAYGAISGNGQRNGKESA